MTREPRDILVSLTRRQMASLVAIVEVRLEQVATQGPVSQDAQEGAKRLRKRLARTD